MGLFNPQKRPRNLFVCLIADIDMLRCRVYITQAALQYARLKQGASPSIPIGLSNDVSGNVCCMCDRQPDQSTLLDREVVANTNSSPHLRQRVDQEETSGP